MSRENNVLQIIINGTNRAGPALKQAGQQAARMGMVVSGALLGATYRAGQFEKGLAEISTLLDGDTTQAVQQIRGELLDLSTEFGQSIGKMTKARYDVISAGFTGAAESAEVLRSASKLAIAGVSDVAVSADLLTGALGGLQLESGESERVVNVLFQTVRKGKTTLDQLGQGLGKLFGTAKMAGVSLEELGAAMATATASGVQTAESITGLNAMMLALAAPTEEAREALEDAGISMKEGFLQALIDVNKAAGDSPAKLRELIPSIEALRVASVIAGNIGLMTENLEEFNDVTGVVDEGVSAMAETFDYQMQRAKRSVDALVIEIGTAFLPAATEMLDNFNALARGFREGDTDIQAMAKTIGKWALGVTAAGAALSVLASVMTAIGPVIAGMGAAFATATGPMRVAMIAALAIVAALVKYRNELEEKLFPMAKKFNDEQGKTPGILDKVWGSLKKADLATAVVMNAQKAFDALKFAGLAEKMGWDEGAEKARKYAAEMQALSDRQKETLEGGAEAIDTALADGFTSAADSAKDSFQEIKDSISGMLGETISQVQTLFDEMVQAQKDAEALAKLGAIPLGYIPPEPFRSRDNEDGEDGPVTDKTVEDTAKRIQNIKAQLQDLAQFAAEDFMGMAFNIGSAFANVATDISAHMLGLTKGPLMLGQAFKQMTIGILADLSQIIARMMVARALLSAFNFGSGGGIFGSALREMAGFATGGVIPKAATGHMVKSPAAVAASSDLRRYATGGIINTSNSVSNSIQRFAAGGVIKSSTSVLNSVKRFATGGTIHHAASGFAMPGSTGGGYFPPVILPGSPGLDRTPVLAQGGEVVVSRPEVNAMRRIMKEPQIGPRRERSSSRRKMKVEINPQANRPFRREEQVNLTDSVTEGIDRSARYGS